MICLGIESTAHTFGVGIMDDKGKVFANEKDSFTTKKGGMIPFEVSEHHVNKFDEVFKKAIEKAKENGLDTNTKLKNIDVISYSKSPGLGACLRIGAMFARSLAVLTKKPLVGVNHCIAHLEIGICKGAKLNLSKAQMSRDEQVHPRDPVLLYASGANTQVIAYEGEKYRVFGETLDIGVGNFIDTFARELGLGFPGGPKVYELSLNSSMSKQGKLIDFPYSVKGMDVSFGGLLTNAKQKINKLKQLGPKKAGYTKEDLCFSIQETIFAMLVEVSERAMAHCNKDELLLGGGVACNKRLQEMCHIMCKERGAKCFVPEFQFLVDNAAMIAWQGLIEFKAGNRTAPEKAGIDPYERTDDVLVNWKQ